MKDKYTAIAKSLIIVGAMAAASSAFADFGDINPYMGIDYQQSVMKMKSPFATVAKKSFPGASLYLGTKFHENFGVEIGYNWSTDAKKDFNIPANTVIGNVTTAAATTGSSKIRRSGAFVDLLAFLPVADSFELFGSLGMGWVKPAISISNVAGTNANVNAALGNLSARAKSVFRLGIGASYMIGDLLGVRVKVGYEGTSAIRLKDTNTSLSTLGLSTKGFRDSTTVGAGVFVKF